MATGTGSRRKQRRNVLRILFEMDINCSTVEEVLKGKRLAGEDVPGDFGIEIIRGVNTHLGKLDKVISRYSQGWDIERMPLVDRNILRMALVELFFISDIPTAVTIDEAVELAKTFSTEDSGKFVNGVLGKINSEENEVKMILSEG
ncbi:MAG: transcription antitermination factor NusB [Actinobacteria bacterium]|nr:transcription antitermination factor NusB [Actinomycetota bacterium]